MNSNYLSCANKSLHPPSQSHISFCSLLVVKKKLLVCPVRHYQEASPYPAYRILLDMSRQTVTLGRRECGDPTSKCHGKC